MIYLVDKQHLEKIDIKNLPQVISFIFKDYPDIVNYYLEVIDLLSEKSELIVNVKNEIIWMLDEFSKSKEEVNNNEKLIIDWIRKNFEESNKIINSKAQKIFIEKKERYDKEEQKESLNKIFDDII